MSDDPAPCEFLPWDTGFFGHRTARVTRPRLTRQQIQTILAWCAAESIGCLYFLADADHPATIRLAERHGFRLVDVRVTMRWSPRDPSLVLPLDDAGEPASVRLARGTDVPALEAMARHHHTDTRFYSDPHFSRASCRELYATWMRRSCEGWADAVLVAEDPADDRLLGYLSCHGPDAERVGRIGLFGVARNARGRGIGSTLVHHALDWFAGQEVNAVTVVTQGRNVNAQRLYQRCGFVTDAVQLWYHKWLPSAPRGGDA